MNIGFDEFLQVFEYLIIRLKKHAIINDIVENEVYGKTRISFLLLIKEIGQPKEVIEEVLNFFINEDDRYEKFRIGVKSRFKIIKMPIIPFFYYEYKGDKIHIQIMKDTDIKVKFLLQFFNNLKDISNDSNKRDLFTLFIKKSKELKRQGLVYVTTRDANYSNTKDDCFFAINTTLYDDFGEDISTLAKEVFNTRVDLPRLKNNEDYYESDTDLLEYNKRYGGNVMLLDLEITDNQKKYHDKLIDSSQSNIQLDYMQKKIEKNYKDRAKGGENSYSKKFTNPELKKIVYELILEYSATMVHFNDKNSLYDKICTKLESDYYDILKGYSSYKRYLKDENVDWERTIKDWCRDFIKDSNIKLNIKKTKKKYHRKS